MSSASFFLSPRQLWSRIGTADVPTILDVRRQGFVVYDALFAWARHAADERHNWSARKTETAA
jgi:hypothetical protein